MNFEDLSAMLDRHEENKVKGFVINPMSDNLVFSTEMVAAMKKDMEKGPVDMEDDAQEDLDDFENKEETEE